MPIPRICRVCNAKADSSHFGAESCRACAAFFSRTVLLSRKLVCRQSKNNCTVSTDVRFTCRRCRFVKCLAVGMKPENVPTNPNPRISDEQWMKNHPSETESAQASPSQTCLLDVITEQYRILEQIAARNDDRVMREALGDRIQQVNGHLQATIGLQNKCIRASHQSVIDFATSCFPEIGEFDEAEKWLVLKNFMTSRFIFDSVNRAQKFFPGNNKMFMVTFHTFVDIDNIEFYLSDLASSFDKQQALGVMREMTRKCTTEWLGPLLTRAAITEVESMAIYGLLCWPIYLASASARVREVCYKYHQRIFQELQQHYRETGQADYSSRIAHITSILLCVQAAIQRLKEDMQIYRLLDVYNGNEFVYKVVK